MYAASKPINYTSCPLAHCVASMTLAAASSCAMAAYKVELEVPRPLKQLLSEHLDLMRYRDREDIDTEMLGFMVGAAPASTATGIDRRLFFAGDNCGRRAQRHRHPARGRAGPAHAHHGTGHCGPGPCPRAFAGPLSEYPLQRIRSGIGYSTDTGATVSLRYSHNSVLQPALVLDTELVVEQKRQPGRLELAPPPRPGGFVDSLNISAERSKLQGLEQLSRRARVQRVRSGERRATTYALTYYRDRLERLDQSPLPSDTIVEPRDHQAAVASIEKV